MSIPMTRPVTDPMKSTPPPLSNQSIEAENRRFEGTTGVSDVAAALQLIPAFQDARNGRVEIARFANGLPAPMHLIDGLPDEWTLTRDEQGNPASLKCEIICGFLRGDRFYTREEAAAL